MSEARIVEGHTLSFTLNSGDTTPFKISMKKNFNFFSWIPRWLKRHPSPHHAKSDLQIFIEHLIQRPIHHLELYEQALTHRSCSGITPQQSNERLEFLGDSMINSIVGHALYELYPEEDEGTLTLIRSFIVNRNHLNGVGERMGLPLMIRCDESLDLRNSDVVGNAFEALVGAIYLDHGYDITACFIRQRLIVSKKNVRVVAQKEEDYKTEFIILMQKEKIRYEFKHIDTRNVKGQGDIHRCSLIVGEDNPRELAIGVGTSKKIAHQNAAKDALRLLEKNPGILQEVKV